MAGYNLEEKVAEYVDTLLHEKLPATLYFHNYEHTKHVVSAAMEIGAHVNLTQQDMLIVEVAAWFHDCGYLYHYTGHEESSKLIAGAYLAQMGADKPFIDDVLNCINATKMPQAPTNLVQQVICDADLYHFTAKDYQETALRLKKEWEVNLSKHYSNREWDFLNLRVLKEHSYFTTYGKTVMQKLKEENIALLKKSCFD